MTVSTALISSEWLGRTAEIPSSPLFSNTGEARGEGEIGWHATDEEGVNWYSRPLIHESSRSSEPKIGESWLASSSGKLSSSQVVEYPAVDQQSELLAEWDGFVTDIGEHYFSASLNGVFGQGVEGESEEAEIPISDVNRSELDLFGIGSVFRLCVLHEELPNGQPRRFTQVVFRRLPAYRSKDIKAAEERADLIHQRLRVE